MKTQLQRFSAVAAVALFGPGCVSTPTDTSWSSSAAKIESANSAPAASSDQSPTTNVESRPAATAPRGAASTAVSGHIVAEMPRVLSKGETFTVRVSGRGFDQTTEGGGLNLKFDPTVAQVENVAIDLATWEFAGKEGEVDNAHGEVKGVLFASFAGRKGNFPIATVTFRALSSKRRALHLQLEESPLNRFAGDGKRLAVSFDP